MITIIMNDDKSLRKSITSPVYTNESGEFIILCIPQYYNNYDFNNCFVRFNCINNSNICDSIIATKLNELRSNYMQYNVPISKQMTNSNGNVIVWIEIYNNDGFLLKSGETTIEIINHREISDCLSQQQITLFDQYIAKMEQYIFESEQIKAQIKETYNNTIEAAKLVLDMCKEMEEKYESS